MGVRPIVACRPGCALAGTAPVRAIRHDGADTTRGGDGMADPFLYLSHVTLEYHHRLRHAYLGEVPQPVVYGVQGALRAYYGAAEAPPIASTLDQIVAAVGG